MQFPRTEAEIAKLGEIVVQGLEQATEDFPAPPVPPADLSPNPRRGDQERRRVQPEARAGSIHGAQI